MSYESYERKILKIKKIRDTIVKYRYLILAIVIAIGAMVCGLLGVKGIFTKSLDVQSTYVYGTELDFDANAIFAEVRYEYRNKDGEWTEIVPDMPGEYEVRAAAKRGFGGENHTETYAFRITKKPINVAVLDADITYGDMPTIGVFGLVDGDVFDEEGLRFTFTDVTTKPTAWLDVDSFKIVDGEGKDKTSAYDFKGRLEEEIPLTLRPRTLEVTFGSAEQYYNKQALSCEEWSCTKGSLAFSDVLAFDNFSTRLEVGTVANLADLKVFNEQGLDVTSLYNYSLIEGSLQVKRIPLKVSTDSAEKVYDGTALTNISYDTESIVPGVELLDGHRLVVMEHPEITDVGSVENVLEFQIRDENEANVGNVYQLTMSYGLLTVNQRPITIQPAEGNMLYNGKAYTSAAAKVTTDDGLVAGESLSVVVKTRDLDGNNVDAINVGTYKSYIEAYSIMQESSGKDKTGNYLVTTASNTVTIDPRSIAVQMSDTEKVYDGLSVQKQQVSYELIPITDGMTTALADGQAETILSLSARVDAGFYPGENTIELDIVDGNNDSVKENYIIEVRAADLRILKREVWLGVQHYQPIYDGKAHVSTDCAPTSGSLVLNHEPILTLHTESLDGVPMAAINAGWYNNVVDSWEVYAGKTPVSENYELHVSDGTIYVQQRPIQVLIKGQSKTYDDQPFVPEEYVYECKPNDERITDALVEDQTASLQPIFEMELINAGTYTNVLQGNLVVKLGEEDTTDNYAISYSYGNVTIDKKVVHVQVELISKIYDGIPVAPIEGDTYTVSETHAFLEGHTETLVFWMENAAGSRIDNAINVGTYSCGVKAISVLSADGRNVTDNYAPQTTDNTLTIDYRPIKITISGATKVYDGEPFQQSEFTYVPSSNSVEIADADALAVDEEVELRLADCIKVGEYKPKAKISHGSKDTTSNYDIEYIHTELTCITKRSVSFNVFGDSNVYNGKEISGIYCEEKDGSLAGGDRVTIHVLTDGGEKAIYAGTYTNITATFANAKGEDVTNCYALGENTLDGQFEITKRAVEVHVDQLKKTYDGKPFTEKEVMYSVPMYGFVEGDKLVANVLGIENCIDVGTYERESWEIQTSVQNSAGKDISDSYEITCQYNAGGSMIITPRGIEVKPINKTQPYDGNPFTSSDCETINGTSLVQGHKIEATTNGEVTGIGSVWNQIIGTPIIRDASGKDVSHNYTITTAAGRLEVIKRAIYIMPLKLKRAYNGKQLVYPENYPAEQRAYAKWQDEANMALGAALYKGCYLNAEIEISEYITNVGSAEVYITECIIYDESGVDVTNLYYDVEWLTTAASITQRELIITSRDVEKTYDGATLYGSAEDCYISKGSLVGNDTIVYEVKASVTDVGTTVNQIRSVTIYDENGHIQGKAIFNEYGELTEGNGSFYNYSIQIECGTLKVVDSIDKEFGS